MLFNSFEFILFFIVVTVGYFVLPFRWRWVLLLAGSYFFYMCWRWEYIFLIAAQTIVNYLAAIALQSVSGRRTRLWIVGSAATATLGLLFVFKYLRFAAESLNGLLALTGAGDGVPILDILLPVGISFYSFQALSYTLDVYRGHVNAERHLGRFALYVSFFPQLVAGPIERATNLLGQFSQEHRFDVARMTSGLNLFLWGLFKKVVIADRLSIYVDRIYSDPTAYSGPTLLLASYFFAFQIYCDFSGYSDMAIGVARVLGFKLMANFRLPYFAQSIPEFWSRWHISLSSWFRDYLYIPMGGSRVGRRRWAANILVVFLVSGLWHGANFTFLAWGALHGIFYLVSKITQPLRQRISTALRCPPGIAAAVRVLVTFHLVLAAWVVFRARSIGEAAWILRQIATDLGGAMYWGASRTETLLGMVAVLVLLAVQGLQARGRIGLYATRSPWPVAVRWAAYLLMLFAIIIFGVSENAFIYFQF